MELRLLLIDAGLQGGELRLRSIETGARLIQLLFADYAGGGQLRVTIVLLLCPLQVRFLSSSAGLLVAYGRLLLKWINLN